MAKMFGLVLAAGLFAFSGCGGQGATDTSGSVPPPSTEDTQKEVQQAMESGKIDPATYGKSQ